MSTNHIDPEKLRSQFEAVSHWEKQYAGTPKDLERKPDGHYKSPFTSREFHYFRLGACAAQASAAPAGHPMSQAVLDVLAERRRQVETEGYDMEHDEAHVMGEIGALAALYLMPDGARDWDATSTTYGTTLGQALLPEDWTMPTMGEDRRRDLVKGIACGLAELERWDRALAQTNGGSAA
ncbi:hypothetical protein EDF72_1752 [Delftia acidovorans]|uniref:hypothetical protein n=1 Tax=Delftia acidovorans TaxID=80866 RepID=UPI000F9DC397|nr:hypothetical protein [Delftia acidovorans]ROR02618.1 hypothetical protein EDF72_1752 [Delftia acidovorans]